MRVLPKSWGRLRYIHISTGTYATLAESRNGRTNAFVHLADDSEPTEASLDGPLSSMTVAVKDTICTSDMPTTCSSLMLKDFSSPYDATVVQLLRTAGARVIGKTNCDEFGMGSLNKYSVHGPVINPFGESERRSAGGSSGGSAAAVAAGLCDVALGTDTGGSIRLPASYCGVVGLKPSYGLLSRWGIVSFADSLDCVGILAKDVESAESVFDSLNICDPRDPTAATQEVRERALKSVLSDFLDSGSLSGIRIGVPSDYFPEELHPSVVDPLRALLADLKAHGASIVPVSLPSTPYALSAYYVIASAEASSNLARYDGVQYGLHVETPPGSDKRKTANVYAHSRSLGFGPEVKRRILLGTYALTADAFDNYFLQAQRVRSLVRRDFDRVFRAPNVLSAHPETNQAGVDVLIHPSAIRTAPPLDEDNTGSKSNLDSYLQDVLTVPASLAGLPALSVPMGLGEDGWPVGVSLVGQWGHEKTILNLGKVLGVCRSSP